MKSGFVTFARQLFPLSNMFNPLFSVRENSMQSYQEMLVNIRELLREKYKQKPQLSSSRPMNMAELFHM
jgi:hypothetical protein